MTANIELTTQDLTKITGLTDGKTYFIQSQTKNGGIIVDTELITSATTPSNTLKGSKATEFKISKQSGIDIYVRVKDIPVTVVVEEL